MGFEIPVSRLAALAADEIKLRQAAPSLRPITANMIASIIDRFTGLPQLLDALQFIANQECENKGEYASCLDTGICVTEYCLPCYARASLLKHRSLCALYP